MNKPIFENEEEANDFFVNLYLRIYPEHPRGHLVHHAIQCAKDEGYIKQTPMEEVEALCHSWPVSLDPEQMEEGDFKNWIGHAQKIIGLYRKITALQQRKIEKLKND